MSLMKGKKGLIMGVANERSIAWGISQKLAEAGAELAFTYLGDALKKRVVPLAEKLNSNVTFSCDVEKKEEVVKLFEDIKSQWGEIDFVVHAVAFSDKSELSGEYLNTTRENFKKSLDISTYSFIEIARRSHPLMIAKGGTLLTLTYQGSNRVTPFYNVMGVAKAALEATTRYLANDLGADGIRVNAISPGPMKTLAGAAIGGARKTFKHTEMNSPLRSNASLEAVGGTAVYLASDAGAYTTGEVIYVDGGYHVLGMPQSENI